MDPESFVSFISDPESKLPKYTIIFSIIYTITVILLTYNIIYNAIIDIKGDSSENCSNWEQVEFLDSNGDPKTGSICTSFDDDGQNSLSLDYVKYIAG